MNQRAKDSWNFEATEDKADVVVATTESDAAPDLTNISVALGETGVEMLLVAMSALS